MSGGEASERQCWRWILCLRHQQILKIVASRQLTRTEAPKICLVRPPNNAHCLSLDCQFSVTMVGPSPHKPRRKVKKSSNDSEASSVASTNTGRSSTVKPAYPLAAFLWPARSSVSQWEILPLVLMAVGLFRWAAGLWGYSGMFEASTKFLC